MTTPSFYDDEAAVYDRTRGGDARADAAAGALARLLPDTGVVADVGGGTGIVSARLATVSRRVFVADASAGMLSLAARRLPGRAVRADATRLPVRTASVDAVVCLWLLHLLTDATADAVLAEAARVLRPGGVLATTVDKNDSHTVGCDIDAIVTPLRRASRAYRPWTSDARTRVTAVLAGHGLTVTGEARFTGAGQGRRPAAVAARLADDRFFPWLSGVDPADRARAITALRALPGQDTPRTDPVFTLVAYRRSP